jgi:type II restriction enzyme
MELTLNLAVCEPYKSASQKARVLSEAWAAQNAFCCVCGGELQRADNNARVLDLICVECEGGFELKSTRGSFSNSVPDGAFTAMMARLSNIASPHFFFLTYDVRSCHVTNFFAVPTYFVDGSVIEKRKPLGSNAIRAGWIGCNIVLNRIPEPGRIFYVRNSEIVPRSVVLEDWRRTTFLRRQNSLETRGWVLETLRCIQSLNSREFTLQQMYEFEPRLKARFPRNNFVREKIRQQLQVLRDGGLIRFESRGRYATTFKSGSG